MSKHSIYILTGDINTGKTTAIANWVLGRSDVFGILTPKNNGKRLFQNIQTGEQFEMEASANEAEILEIGRYKFSSKSFEKASSILQKGLQQSKGWLVVDEVGPLELQQKGFYRIMNEAVADKNNELKKLFVVRQGLVEEVISLFKIEAVKVITDLSGLE